MAKGLLVSVYRHADGYDCTNGGVSSRIREFVLTSDVSVPPVYGPFEAVDTDHELVLTAGPRNTLRAIPRALFDSGEGCCMFGGNFVWSSDSRFPSDGPIKIFDREE